MAQTRSNPSQPNDASQEPQREDYPTEHKEARDVIREGEDVQMNGAEEVLMERARVPGDLIQGSGLVNDANCEEGLVNGSGSARASDEASAPPAPVENAQPEPTGPMLNVFPSSLEAEDRREGLRRCRECEAVRGRNEQAAQNFLARPGLTGLVNDKIPLVHGAAQGVRAEQPVPIDEDEIAHLNNHPVAARDLSPETRGRRRRREPTEEDYLNPRVWRRRAPDGAQYITPPRDFHPSNDENEEAFRRSRQRPACQPEYIPERSRRTVPKGERPERPPVQVPPVNRDQVPFRGPWERVRARVRAQDGMFNGETGRPRARTPMPARPLNDENMEPEGPRMRSISLEPRARPFFEAGDGAAAPPPVYVPAARPLGNLPKIQMPEFQGKKGVPTQMWLESLTRFQNLY
jgi:hypothetical protein